MKIGLWLPTFARAGLPVADRSPIAAASRAEELGFDSLWTLDHLLPAERVHAASWYDPLVALAAAAAATESIELGTASLVVGFRHPFALAKQLASIAALAGPRVALGASSGWYADEYTLFGYEMRERGRRTDECLRAVRRLLDEPVVTFEGRYWSFAAASLVPRPSWHLPILVGGGSRLPEAGSEYDVPVMAEPVLARIVAHDGWLAPCAGTQSLTLADLATVRAAAVAAGKRDFRYLHVQWIHVVDTADREEALAAQLPALRRIMGRDRSDEHLAECYLTGSRDDISARIGRLRDAGFDELVLGPVSADPAQLELIADVARSATDADELVISGPDRKERMRQS
jgi:alkanesulfonate monooxygenase SsuD/methylene tetrahydromethanopterin reductase-like flavin-dependent oxidoreductase (luciferase family)